MVHHPRSFNLAQEGQPLPRETKDRLFITSVEVIEFSYLLEQNENTARWGWLFRTYMQWQSVAFVLSEICQRPPGSEIDRAWRAVESVYDVKLSSAQTNHKGMLWKPMKHLMAKAKAIRAKQVQAGPAQPLDVKTPSSQFNALDPWVNNFPYATFLSASADALDVDLSQVFSPQGSEQSGGSGFGALPARSVTVPQQPNISDAQMTGLTKSPEMGDLTHPDFLNWNAWTPAVGDFNVAPEPVLQYFSIMQQEWF